MVTNKQDAKQKHADLYAFRQRYVSNWQRIAQYVDPEKKFNINGAVYQSTGTDLGYLDQTLERALRVNAAGQHELITPKSQVSIHAPVRVRLFSSTSLLFFCAESQWILMPKS